MHRPMRVPASLLLLVLGCAESPTAQPLELEGAFDVKTVNGVAVPFQRIEVISNDAGTCEMDIVGGHMSFGVNASYNMSITYSRDCAGAPDPVRSFSIFQGTYTRSGSELELTTRVFSGDNVERVVIDGNGIIVDIRRTSGTRFQLRFEPIPQT